MNQDFESWRSCAQRYFERRVRDPHAVDDLVQETCVNAWLSERNGRATNIAPGWVLGISWRMLARHRRRAAHQRKNSKSETDSGRLLRDVPAQARERGFQLEDQELPLSRLLVVLERCAAELPLRWRGLVRDRMDGLSLKQIADNTGLSVNVIKLRLYRGRRALKEAMLASLREEDARAFQTIDR